LAKAQSLVTTTLSAPAGLAASAEFGRAVSIDPVNSHYMIVGAPGFNRAYIYTRGSWYNSWEGPVELRPAATPASADRFGGAVAVHDSLAIVAHTGTNRLSLFRKKDWEGLKRKRKKPAILVP
jgi:hypothetical protein